MNYKIKGLNRQKKLDKKKNRVVKHGRSNITTSLNMNVCKDCSNTGLTTTGAFCNCKQGNRRKRQVKRKRKKY